MTNFQKRFLSSLLLIPIALFFIIKGTYFFNFFISICLLISIYEWHLVSKYKIYKIPGIIFLLLSYYSAYYFRNEMHGDYIYFIMILFICVFTDIGGYIFGKMVIGFKKEEIIFGRMVIGKKQLMVTFGLMDIGIINFKL